MKFSEIEKQLKSIKITAPKIKEAERQYSLCESMVKNHTESQEVDICSRCAPYMKLLGFESHSNCKRCSELTHSTGMMNNLISNKS